MRYFDRHLRKRAQLIIGARGEVDGCNGESDRSFMRTAQTDNRQAHVHVANERASLPVYAQSQINMRRLFLMDGFQPHQTEDQEGTRGLISLH